MLERNEDLVLHEESLKLYGPLADLEFLTDKAPERIRKWVPALVNGHQYMLLHEQYQDSSFRVEEFVDARSADDLPSWLFEGAIEFTFIEKETKKFEKKSEYELPPDYIEQFPPEQDCSEKEMEKTLNDQLPGYPSSETLQQTAPSIADSEFTNQPSVPESPPKQKAPKKGKKKSNVSAPKNIKKKDN